MMRGRAPLAILLCIALLLLASTSECTQSDTTQLSKTSRQSEEDQATATSEVAAAAEAATDEATAAGEEDTDTKDANAETTEESGMTASAVENDDGKNSPSVNLIGALVAVGIAGGVVALLWCLWRKKRVASRNRVTADEEFLDAPIGRDEI